VLSEKIATVIGIFRMITEPGSDPLAMTIKQSVHHRPQLSSQLLSIGRKVPEIYGPSADTQLRQHRTTEETRRSK
jgi:uncharacterized damage-inducible protein DinB